MKAIPKVKEGQPIIGMANTFGNDRLNTLTRIRDQYGDIAEMKFFHRSAYVLNNPEYVHQVLVKDADKFHKSPNMRRNLGRIIGEGLLTSNGDFHRQQRRLVQPAFHRQRISNYGDTMLALTQQRVEDWHERETVEIHDEMMTLTMEIVAQALFGTNLSGQSAEISQHVSLMIETGSRQFSRPLLLLWSRVPTPANRRMMAATQRLDDVIYAMIDERRRSGEDRGDLLSMLLLAQDEESGVGMSNQQVRDEAMTIFLAGHETTANALTWAFYLLAENPAAQDMLTEEVDRVLGGRPVAVTDLAQLPYSRMVIQEAMRLYPPAWITSRYAIQDVDIDGYLIPANSVVIASPYLMHHHPRYWQDPEAFIPTRFLTHEDSVKAAYFPFSAGPRVCIGNHFAMMEMQIVLITALQRLRFSTVAGQQVEAEPQITLRPKHGIHLALEQRVAALV
ncbi:MAG: cytochrome P450 [Phototrophicaceae bacterium]